MPPAGCWHCCIASTAAAQARLHGESSSDFLATSLCKMQQEQQHELDQRTQLLLERERESQIQHDAELAEQLHAHTNPILADPNFQVTHPNIQPRMPKVSTNGQSLPKPKNTPGASSSSDRGGPPPHGGKGGGRGGLGGGPPSHRRATGPR